MEDTIDRCLICLKTNNIIKCNDCTFLSCEQCIIKWYETSNFACPQCKKSNTYTIDYSKVNVNDNDDMPPLITTEINNIINQFNNLFNDGQNDHTQNYTNQVLMSALGSLTTDVITDILQDGQVFGSDEFEHNYQSWPEIIRNRWAYRPINMTIDDTEEIVGYVIRRRNTVINVDSVVDGNTTEEEGSDEGSDEGSGEGSDEEGSDEGSDEEGSDEGSGEEGSDEGSDEESDEEESDNRTI